MTRWEGASNESIYERCGMGPCINGVKCGVVEWVKINSLRLFGHMERKKREGLVKKVYVSGIKGPRLSGRPVVRRKDMVKEYMHQSSAYRGEGIEQVRKESLDRERWRLFCHGHPLWGYFWMELVIRNYR